MYICRALQVYLFRNTMNKDKVRCIKLLNEIHRINAHVASRQLLVSRNLGTEKKIPAIVTYTFEGDK